MANNSPVGSNMKWHPILVTSSAICRVWLMQAGTITLPEDFVLLPKPNTRNRSFQQTPEQAKSRSFKAPDFVFLVEHVPTGEFFLYDLGMRKDLHNLSPHVREVELPIYDCSPTLPQDILAKHSPNGYKSSKVKAVILSHLHWDHIGDCGRELFPHAQLWLGPSACSEARPGYPHDKDALSLATDFPSDGSRKIVEFTIPQSLLEKTDCRRRLIKTWHDAGHYNAIECRIPKSGWKPLGSFELAFDLFEDGSAYVVDTPGHAAGHQSLLLRVRTPGTSTRASSPSSTGSAYLDEDNFVFLVGDWFHHPALLQDPFKTARTPYSCYTVHIDPDLAINTLIRTRELAKRENVWVIASHDMSIMRTLSKGEDEVVGLVALNDWRQKGWKGHQAQLHAAAISPNIDLQAQ